MVDKWAASTAKQKALSMADYSVGHWVTHLEPQKADSMAVGKGLPRACPTVERRVACWAMQ